MYCCHDMADEGNLINHLLNKIQSGILQQSLKINPTKYIILVGISSSIATHIKYHVIVTKILSASSA